MAELNRRRQQAEQGLDAARAAGDEEAFHYCSSGSQSWMITSSSILISPGVGLMKC